MLTRLIKFVALLLVGSSVVIPGSAVGACLLEMLAARHCGHCPMMMDTQSGSQIKGQPTSGDGSCCQVSTVPPITRKFTFTNRNWGRAQINHLQSAGVTISPRGVDQTVFHETVPSPSCSSHQALLCTFLI